MEMATIIITIYSASTTGALAWLFKTVIDLQAEVKVLQSQRDQYLRELDKIDKRLDDLWEEF